MAEPTTLFPNICSKAMKSFKCDLIEVRFRFKPSEMNIAAFLKAVDEFGVSTEPDEDGDRQIVLIFACDDESNDYHSHVTVSIWSDESGSVEIGYYTGGAERAVPPPLNVANCANWLGEFFTTEVRAHVHLNYTFDKSFVPSVSLNFPLTTTEKGLAGTVVSGLALVFPTYPNITAIIQSGGNNETYLFLRKTVQMNLKDFQVVNELESMSVLVSNLIKKAADA